MGNANKLLFAALGLSAAALTSQATAQQTAQQNAAREADGKTAAELADRNRNWRIRTMKITRWWLGLLAWVVAVTATSMPAATQTAQQGEARDAAIRRCIQQARQQFPSADATEALSEAYKACMVAAGFQP
jgi:hypothetical protein